MLKPHQQNPIPNEALKGFLLHEEPLVRDLVTYYFHESWSLDEGLIPLVLEAYRRFGEEAAYFSLGHARRFPLNTSSLLESALELERSQPPCVEDWLARAPLPLVESHEDLLRSVLSFSVRARVETWFCTHSGRELSPERDHIKEHFERERGTGFDYAYMFPGMNRVLQAAGRAIRSDTDRGAVLLMDERFAQARYRALLLVEWEPTFIRDDQALRTALTDFWQSSLVSV